MSDRNMAEDVLWHEVQALRDRNAALEEKCTLLAASLKQADAERDAARWENQNLHEHIGIEAAAKATARAEVARLREACQTTLSELQSQAADNQGWTAFMGAIVRLRAALADTAPAPETTGGGE